MNLADPALSDRALVAAVLAAEPGAFERLVREHQSLCWHILLRLVRDPEEARDLCQETFLRVHRRLDQYRFDSALKTWIGRVAYNIALRHLERHRIPLAEPPTEDADDPLHAIASDEDIAESAARAQTDAIVRAHMVRLPPIQSLLLSLYHLDELTIAEIVVVTGLPAGTIKSHLARARARLRARLAIALGESP